MAINQVSNKSEITFRGSLDRALQHGEADQNFKQLENVIDDVTSIIKSISKIDDIQTIIDNSLSGPLKSFSQQMETMTTRVQTTIDSLNASSQQITEAKEVANTSHNQISKAASTILPGTEFSDYDQNSTDLMLKILNVACKKYAPAISTASTNTKGLIEFSESDITYYSVREINDITAIEEFSYKNNPLNVFIHDYAKACEEYEKSGGLPVDWFVEKYSAKTMGPYAIMQYIEYNYVPRSAFKALEERLASVERQLAGSH